MKKICFIFGGNIKMCPYLNNYLNSIGNNVEFDIIYWERYEAKKNIIYSKKPNKLFIYKKKILKKIDKIIGFYSFKKYVENILVKNKYDKIVFLQTNMAIMCEKYILKNSNIEYFLDVRDYSNEHKLIVKNKEKRIFPRMKYISISSEGFKSFLPSNFNYITVHNLQNNTMMVKKEDVLSKKITSLKIGYIGNMSLYCDYLIKVISLFKNDDRYVLYFIGIGSDKLKDFCEKNKIQNVVIRGEFKPEDINQLYKEIDIVNNLYGNNNPYLDFALSNKLYLAAQYSLPILVCPKTSMEEISLRNKFGYVVDINDSNIKDNLYNWYVNLDFENLFNNCVKFNNKVVQDNFLYKKILNDFFGGEK